MSRTRTLKLVGNTHADLDQAVLIVTGSTLRAEQTDRPIAYALAEAIRGGLDEFDPEHGLTPVVCSDIWFLNQEEARVRPTVSLGGPGDNALTAYLTERFPTAESAQGEWAVQCEEGLDDAIALLWGVDAAGTQAAVAAFMERRLGLFVRSAVRL